MKHRHLWLLVVALAFAACSDESNSPVSSNDTGLHKEGGKASLEDIDITDRYIIVFKDHVRNVDAMIDEVTRGNGSAVHFRYRHALRGFAATLPLQARQAIERNPNVAWVEADGIATANQGQQLNPPSWGLDRIDQRTLPLNSTYNYQNGGSGVRVYILDTGIRFNHQEYNGRAFSGWDFIDNDPDASDCQGHGTHVAGTVGGATVGVAKQVTLISVRVLNCNGSGTWSGVIAGIDWVTANHVKPAVANMSLGGSYNSSVNTAVTNSINAGVTYVVAAGNNNANACNYSPASTANALTVGATTSSDSRASYSNFGSCVDLFAPGSGIYSSTMNGTNTYASWNGTSMAAPHVAGVAALFLNTSPNATPAQVETAITSNATTGVLSSIGSGSPNTLLYSLIAGPAGNPPASASNLSVTNPTNNSLTLNWTDNSDNESGFRIERSGSSNGPWSQIATVGSNVQSYINSGLSSGHTYYYRVIAYNSWGDAAPSSTASGTTTNTLTAVHVAGLNGYATGNSNNWYGNLTVTVRDANNNLVQGVTVSVSWGSGSGSAMTNSNGQATVTTSRFRRGTSSVTMTVTNLSGSGFSYNSAANTPNPPTVTVQRP
jgi:hypothetical protein